MSDTHWTEPDDSGQRGAFQLNRRPHARSTQMMAELRVGETVPYQGQDSLLIKLGRLHPASEGAFAYRECIHHLPNNPHDPFAVHILHYDDEQSRFIFGSGIYCSDIDRAVRAFTDRT
jgi:hypothetical protein